MYRLKYSYLLFFIFAFHFGFSAIENERKIAFLESLIDQGDYEDAILEGELQLKKYTKNPKFIVSEGITKALLSRAYFHWYHFKESDRYFKSSFDIFNELILGSDDKFDVGLFLVETALQRYDFEEARLYLEIMPKPGYNTSIANKVSHARLQSKALAAFGNFTGALRTLDAVTFEANEMLLKEYTELKMNLEIDKLKLLVHVGNLKDADTLRNALSKRIKDDKIRNTSYDFYITLNEADVFYIRRQYYKAALTYLKAYHALEGSEEEFRRFEALKMSAISSIKAGTVADYHKLFRRSDMLAFKKPIKSQAFRPGVMQLRLEELLESGQFQLALEKAKDYTNVYKFLPSNNPYLKEFLLIKANAAESVGDIKTYAQVLDTLDKFVSINFTPNSLSFADVQLRKAELNAKYQGQFSDANIKFTTYFDGYVKSRIASSSSENIPYYDGQIKTLVTLSKNDSVAQVSKKALETAVRAFGINSPEALYFESILAFSQFNLGLYKQVQQTLTSINARKISESDESNIYFLQSLFIQAQLYEWLGEYSRVRELVNQANEVSISKTESRFYDKTSVAEAMGNAYFLSGNFLKADRNFKFSIENKLKLLGENSFLLLEPYLQMSNLKIQKGEIKEADRYLEAFEKVSKLYFPIPNSKFHAEFFACKSRYYLAIADYRKAKDALTTAISITTTIYGKSHIRLAPLYAELAKMVIVDNNLNIDEALKHFETAKQIIENSIGKGTPVYMKLIVQQASVMIESGKYGMAEQYLNDAEKFWTVKLGNENQQLGEIQYIRGSLFYSQKKYSDAEKAFKKSANLYEAVFNKRHPGYLTAQTGLAKVAYMFNQYSDASNILEPVLLQRLKFIDNNFSVLSFGQKTGFWASFRDEFEMYNSIATKLISTKAQINKSADMYNFSLVTKGLLLNSDAKLRRQIFNSNDSSLIANFNEWQFQKEYFALVSSFSKAQLEEEKISLDKIEINIENIEKQIQSKVGVNINSKSKKINWLDVKRAIGTNGTAIEMVKFRYFNHSFTDSVIYASLLVDQSTKDAPKLVLMGNGKRMEGRSLNYYRNATINKQEDIYSYQTYLMPLKAHIPDGNMVYFAGEGVYTQINPEMLFNADVNKYALESNAFVFLTSTRDAIVELEKKESNRNIANSRLYLYGNPTFYLGNSNDKKNSISQLAGAEKEVLDINQKLKSMGKETVNLIGKYVTEDTIKSLENAFVLHIATHGYFMERKKTGSELTNNPMLNSGLLMAGAGNLLQNSDIGYINQKPGVLTASEVMDLNFSKTKLVVLSACETGRGQVEVGEGVYGLQRAFLMAGANAIILSLFKVDDEATRLLMLKFYEKFLSNGNDYRKAFREAKQELRNSKEYSSPIYWGAFIMIEGTQHSKAGI